MGVFANGRFLKAAAWSLFELIIAANLYFLRLASS